MASVAAPLDPGELDELRAVYATLPHLRTKPFRKVIADPVFLICLRNIAKAQRDARARVKARVAAAPEDFQLT